MDADNGSCLDFVEVGSASLDDFSYRRLRRHLQIGKCCVERFNVVQYPLICGTTTSRQLLTVLLVVRQRLCKVRPSANECVGFGESEKSIVFLFYPCSVRFGWTLKHLPNLRML